MFHETTALRFIVRVAVGGLRVHRADGFLGPAHELDLAAVVREAGSVPREEGSVRREITEVLAVQRHQAPGVAEVGEMRRFKRLLRAVSALLEVSP